jgi:hypothetical protein
LATKVRFAIPEREIEQSGVTFTRDTDSGRHCQLTVHQNHIVWRPKGKQYVFKVPWEALARFAEKEKWRKFPRATVVRSRKRLKSPAA